MEAKDTVMSDEKILITLLDTNRHCTRSEAIDIIAKAQAKITWDKAIKEVVEWAEERFKKVTGSLVKPYRFIDEEEWQAKLKDWFKDSPELLKKWGIEDGR